jgi:hypothetical protein
MGIVLLVGIAWMVLATSVAVLIGRAIRVADERVVAGGPERLPAFAFEANTSLNFAR